MNKLRATIISLTLIGVVAVLPARAQTDAARQGNGTTAHRTPPSSSSKEARKHTRQHAAQPSGTAQQVHDMEGMPGMKGTQGIEGKQRENPLPASSQQEQQSETPKAGEQQQPQGMEGMPGMEG